VHERHAFAKTESDGAAAAGGGAAEKGDEEAAAAKAGDVTLPRFAGWWGHRASDRFDMAHNFIPSAGAQVVEFGRGDS
jgi:kynureninase